MPDRIRELAEALISDLWIDARLRCTITYLLRRWDKEDQTVTLRPAEITDVD